VSTATLQLNGGTHTFVDGLSVLSNAVVTGCGTINGNVTIYPGGVVAASCGGELTFTGIVYQQWRSPSGEWHDAGDLWDFG
jgi:hypothetical protein